MKSKLQRLPQAVLIASTITTIGLAGDLERFCDPSAGEVVERWHPGVPTSWSVNPGPAQDVNLPNFGNSGASTRDAPGYESIAAGVRTWNSVRYRLNGCNRAPRAGDDCMTGCTPVLSSLVIQEDASPPGSGNIRLDFFNPPPCPPPSGGQADWLCFGGDPALAVSQPSLFIGQNPDTGETEALITSAQIYFQANTGAWGFVEFAGTQTEFNPVPNSQAGLPVLTTTNAPRVAFADIIGVVSHEIGHAIGLGHTPTDSTMSKGNSRTPTMFPLAQVQPFSAVSQLGSLSGQIAGLSARDLEVDDIAAMARGYPVAGTETVTIEGRVDGFDNNFAQLDDVFGVSVTAISRTCPSQVRASTLVYSDHRYRLSGLPPGDYYLYAELVDRPRIQSGTSDTFESDPQYYFPGGGDSPNFVVPEFQGCARTAYLDTSPRMQPEFYEDGDSTGGSPATATLVSVPNGGDASTGRDIVMFEDSPCSLGVRDDSVPGTYSSPRGIQVVSDDTNVTFTVQTDFDGLEFSPPFPHVELVISSRQRIKTYDSFWTGETMVQIPEVSKFGNMNGQSFSFKLQGQFDSSGQALFQGRLGDLPIFTDYRNLFCQARVYLPESPSSTVILSNPVNVWIREY